jgi:hypothetical protein
MDLIRLRHILSATRFLSPTTFTFAGREFVQPDPGAAITQLQEQLYHHCYCRSFSGTVDPEPAGSRAHDGMLDELSAANASRSRWETGWQVYHVSAGGWISAARHGVSQTFAPGEYVTYEGPGVGPAVGASIDVFLARESRRMQEGFYFAFGETVFDEDDRSSLLRFYWNVHDHGAATLVNLATSALNRFQVPFRLKCLSRRCLFQRLDAAVIFVSRRHYQIASALLSDAHGRVEASLGVETPLFTKKLASGWGLAEDPANGESFGMTRCRLLAEALADSRVRATSDEESSVREIGALFRSRGLSLEKPYLNAGSVDLYELAEFVN